jgi:hypothetical protein
VATYSPVSAAVGVQSRFCGVCQGEGVQWRRVSQSAADMRNLVAPLLPGATASPVRRWAGELSADGAPGPPGTAVRVRRSRRRRP